MMCGAPKAENVGLLPVRGPAVRVDETWDGEDWSWLPSMIGKTSKMPI
jgi:hypothetical protein